MKVSQPSDSRIHCAMAFNTLKTVSLVHMYIRLVYPFSCVTEQSVSCCFLNQLDYLHLCNYCLEMIGGFFCRRAVRQSKRFGCGVLNLGRNYVTQNKQQHLHQQGNDDELSYENFLIFEKFYVCPQKKIINQYLKKKKLSLFSACSIS